MTVRAAKPSALVFARSAEVEITRKRGDLPNTVGVEPLSGTAAQEPQNIASVAGDDILNSSSASTSPSTTLPAYSTPPQHVSSETSAVSSLMHQTAIALGSNLGDRFANIELALRLLEALDTSQEAKVTIIDTSFMYETAPMYVTDQPAFINCACLVSLSFSQLTPVDHIFPLDRSKPIYSLVTSSHC